MNGEKEKREKDDTRGFVTFSFHNLRINKAMNDI